MISPFSSLYFIDVFQQSIPNVEQMVYASTDHIGLQYIKQSTEDIPSIILKNVHNDEEIELTWLKMDMIGDCSVLSYILTGLDDGVYVVTIGLYNSLPFRITSDDNDISNTLLLQYSLKNNRSRTDFVAWLHGVQFFFDFRVPGGIADESWIFGIDNTQFVDCAGDICEFEATDYIEKELTVGESCGLNIWFAHMISRIFACDYIYIDGDRYSAVSGGSPSVESVGVNSYKFVVKQRIRMAHSHNVSFENRIKSALRRIPDALRRVNGSQRKNFA